MYLKTIFAFILLSFLFTKSIKSQSNFVFAPLDTKWSQCAGFWTPIIGGGRINHNSYSNLILTSDTTINNKIFQRINSAGSTTKIDTICSQFSYYLLNDSNKIFQGTDPDSMTVFYNFNLAKGDSFLIKGIINNGSITPQTYYAKVDSISYKFYAGRTRKWIRFAPLPYNTIIEWLEGLGDLNYGLITSYAGIMTFNSFSTSNSSLICFIDGGNNLAIGGCSYTNCLLSSNDIFSNLNENYRIYPNPANNEFEIESKAHDNFSLIIIDIGGNEIYHEFVKGIKKLTALNLIMEFT